MNCEFAERISQLIDGEISPDEVRRVRAHIVECSDCQQLEKDFLYLRKQIKESVPLPAWTIASVKPVAGKLPFWKRRILLPAPAFVLLLFMLAAFVVWAAVTADFNRTKDIDSTINTASRKPIERPLSKVTPNEISLSRFDKGGRAEIYTVPKTSSAQFEKSENVKQ